MFATLRPMFSIEIERTFSAAHAVIAGGVRETIHGHNWRTVVRVDGDALDGDGYVCDFHVVEATLQDVIKPFHNKNLNEIPPFDVLNPSAELIAKHIFDQLSGRLQGHLSANAWVGRVSVTEAANCVAMYTSPKSMRRGV
jgi:6-pyruvoyltetrahydropterin/6-carboxytetrahydropterin synthase